MKRLSTVIEAMSIFTAAGIILSAFCHSYVFSQFGLHYLSIATLSDIIKDSFSILIIATSYSVPISILLTIYYNGLLAPRFLKGIVGDIVFSVLISFPWVLVSYASLYVGTWVIPNFSPKIFSDDLYSVALRTAAYTALMSLMMFHAIRIHRESDGGAIKPQSKFLRFVVDRGVLIAAAVTSIFTLFTAVEAIESQISKGLPLTLALTGDVICDGQFAIVWIGEGRFVARCPSGNYVIAMLGE